MASVQKRGKTYQVTVSLGRSPEGKQLRETTTWKPPAGLTVKQTKKALDTFVVEFEQKVKGGRYLSGEKMSVYQFAEIWMRDYVSVHLAPGTQENYRRILDKRILPSLGPFSLAKVTPMHITSLYNKMIAEGLEASSINRYHHILSSMFHTAMRWMIINENPCDAAIVPKITKKREIKCFTEQEAKCFLAALDQTFYITVNRKGKRYKRKYHLETQEQLLFTLALYGGFRRGEMVALTWDDVNFAERTVSVTKEAAYTPAKGAFIKAPKTVYSNRVVSLPEVVFSLFRKVKEERTGIISSNYVFIRKDGKMMHPDTPSKSFKRFLRLYNQSIDDTTDWAEECMEAEKRKKLPMISIHGLRHTSATLLLGMGVDPVTVANRLGHSSASTTLDIYAHALETNNREAGDLLGEFLSR